ncbi:Fe-S-containing protein [Treponema sp.]|uniref:Fe-S-containing protein n=1 Tax=Treponema sp. TaxID=166 RepID=UPI00388D50B7
MSKNLFETVQSLFIPFLMTGFVFSQVKTLNSDKVKSIFYKAALFLAAVILAVSFLREKRLIKYNQINNIYLLVTSVISGLCYAVLNWLYSVRRLKTSAFIYALDLSGVIFVTCLLLYSIPPVFSLPFHFLGMYDTYFSTMYLAKFTGYLAGWLLCFLCASSLYKILSRSSQKVNALIFTLLYLISGFISFVAVTGIINSYYRRKIKIPSGLRKSLPQLITAENVIFFFAIIVIIALSVGFFIYFTKIHGEYSNPAEHRKLKAFARNNRRLAVFTVFLSLLVWTDMTVIKKIANTIAELSPSENFQLEGNEIYIPLEQISDGHLHRFTWTNDAGKGIRFIVVQKKGMSFGVGFDACDVCGDVGYYERKDEVVCNRCDVVMNKSTIGLKGGCNPVPLASRIENGGLIILTDDLQKEAYRFKN